MKPPRPDAAGSRLRGATAVGAAVLVFAKMVAVFWVYLNDDAFIAFRYAANLLEAGELTYNPGEFVEGYTSLAMVLLSAGFIAVAGDANVAFVAKLWGLALAAATIAVTWLAGRRVLGERAAVVPALLLALSPAFEINAASGLETSTFTFLLTLAFLVALSRDAGRDVAFALLMALATFTRPEGAYHFAFVLACRGVQGIGLRRLVRTGAAYGALIAPYALFKLGYYGELLPNTFYAKPGSLTAGAGYLADFVGAGGHPLLVALPVLLLAAGLAAPGGSRGLRIAFVASHLSAIVLSGGDWMLGWRFVVPALPVALITMVCGIRWLVTPLARHARPAAAAVSLGLALGLALASLQPRDRIAGHCREASRGLWEGHRFYGSWLQQNARPGDAIALTDIGIIGYTSRLRVIDISGLTDRHIGRSPGPMLRKTYDTDYVLDQRPRFVLLVHAAMARDDDGGLTPERFWFQDRRIHENPSFAAHYEYVGSRFVRTAGYLSLYRRGDRG